MNFEMSKTLTFLRILIVFGLGLTMTNEATSATSKVLSKKRELLGGFQVYQKEVIVRGRTRLVNKVKVAFFDADSTLRVSKSGKVSANAPEDALVLPCVAPRIAQLVEKGYLIAVISNQGGVSAGIVKNEVANSALRYTLQKIVERHPGVKFHYYDYAAHRNGFRKPGIGMISMLEERLGDLSLVRSQYRNVSIDRELSFMVGDSLFKKKANEKKPNCKMGEHFSNSDRGVAVNYGIRFFDPADFFGWLSFPSPITVFSNKEQFKKVPLDNFKEFGEVLYCGNLPTFAKYSHYIHRNFPTPRWVADYQCLDSGQCLPYNQQMRCER